MHSYKEACKSDRSDSGVSAITGTLLMVALTVVIASVVFYLAFSMNTPQNLTKTSMRILAFNSTTLSITSMVGDSIQINNVNIIVGSNAYNASGIVDSNDNGLWDPGETIYLYGLDLTGQTGVIVATNTQVLMPGTVQWSNNPAPTNTGNRSGQPANSFTSYKPGIRMTEFSDTSFTRSVATKVAEDISYTSPEGLPRGFHSNDPSWPVSDTGMSHNFSVRFEGYLYIDENSTYRFHISASDYISMLIDDMPIINVTGDHPPSTYTPDLFLSAGYHKLEIGYVNFNNLAVIDEFGIRMESDVAYVPPSLFYLDTNNV
jgi:FlaG/FlaF family flagellin (archaellin)